MERCANRWMVQAISSLGSGQKVFIPIPAWYWITLAARTMRYAPAIAVGTIFSFFTT
jgi:hypothetical protein